MGWLKATYDLSSIQATQIKTWRSTLTLSIFWVVCSSVLLLLVLRPLVLAINGLTNFARRLNEHKGEQIKTGQSTQEIVDLAASLNDASQQLRASEEQMLRDHNRLQKSEEKYRELVQKIQAAVVVHGADTRILTSNRQAQQLLGFTEEQMLGKEVIDLQWHFFREDGTVMPLEEYPVNRVLATGESFRDVVMGIHRPTLPEDVWVLVGADPALDKQGKTDQVIVTFTNITERKRAEQERLTNLKFFESLDLVNQAIQKTDYLEQMMSNVLDVVLAVFDCDRAFLMYPCDPEAETWLVPMERNKPEYPGVLELGLEMQMDQDVAESLCILLAADGPVKFGPGTPYALPADVSELFGLKSFMSMAIYSKVDKPWQFGIHQCSFVREWTPEEERLFKEIGRRLEDGLTSLQMYRNMKESERRFSILVNQAADAFFVYDMKGQLLDVNRRACESLGYTREELLGLNIFNVNAEFISYDHEKTFWRKLTQDSPVTLQGRHKRKDNTTFPVEVRLGLLQFEDRQEILALARDITERKVVEEELRQLNEELEARVSDRTAELGKKSLQLLDSQLALMNLVEDLNEQTTKLEEANRELQSLDRLKSMFIASMSHELRTPLNSIIGFSTIVQDEWCGPLNNEQKENLARVERAGRHLLALINDVIDISKIEAGTIDTHSENFALEDLVSEAVAMLKKDIDAKGLLLEVEIGQFYLYTDRRRLFQCLLNLLSNAVKFTEHGSIRMTTKRLQDDGSKGQDFLQLRVSDTGIGIEQAAQCQLFTPFSRITSPLNPQAKGTGLGLYLVKKICREILHGEVGMESAWGKGSSFFMNIPLTSKK
jgi:PAS domain S-box-containing protein